MLSTIILEQPERGRFALGPVKQRIYQRTVSAARAALGADAFNAAWAKGQAMVVEDTIALALAQALNP